MKVLHPQTTDLAEGSLSPLDALLFWSLPMGLLTLLEACVFAWGGRFGFPRGLWLALAINAALIVLGFGTTRFGLGGLFLFGGVALQGVIPILYRDWLLQNLPPLSEMPATGWRFAATLLASYAIKFAAAFAMMVMIAGAIGG